MCPGNQKWTVQVTELNLNCYDIDQSVHYNYLSGSSKIQLMIFIEHVPIKVGVANINWVI